MVLPTDKETKGNSLYWEVEHADVQDGYRLFIKGAEFPIKGRPASAQVLADISLLKRFLAEGIKLLFALPLVIFGPIKFLSKALTTFTILSRRVMKPHLLETTHLSPFSRELELFICISLIELGIHDDYVISVRKTLPVLFSHNLINLIEYDPAYRGRLQDLFSESSPQKLFTWKELKRLEKIAIDRNDERVGKQTVRILKILRYSLLIPRIRKALRKTLGMVNYERLCFDEGDRYWASFQADYKFFGQTSEERMKVLHNKGYKIPFTQKA